MFVLVQGLMWLPKRDELRYYNNAFEIAIMLGGAVRKEKRVWVVSNDTGLDSVVGYWNQNSGCQVMRISPDTITRVVNKPESTFEGYIAFDNPEIIKSMYTFLRAKDLKADDERFLKFLELAKNYDIFKLMQFYDDSMSTNVNMCIHANHRSDIIHYLKAYLKNGNKEALQYNLGYLIKIYGADVITRAVNLLARTGGILA